MKNAIMWFLLLFISLNVSFPVYAEDGKTAVFVSPEGIQFSSYSKLWNEAKLKGLYEMLLRCGHGEEFSELKEVVLNSKSSTGKSGFRVGNYNSKTQIIQLYEVDSLQQVERTLIHEYGHHFTYYWLQKKEGFYPNLLTELSGWSKIRQLEGYPIRWFGSKLPYNHKWDPAEIMAEDYVALFGVGGIALPDQPKDVVNLVRHENEYIPSPQSIPELRSYWEEIAGMKPQKPLGVPTIQQWNTVGVKGENSGSLHVSFTPAADGQQQIKYGVNTMGFGERVSIPVKWTTGLTGSGTELVETQLDVNLFQEHPPSYYYFQIWSLDRENQQLTYTPFYMNWFQYDASSQQLNAVSPPMEVYGWQEELKKEGMEHWPLLNIFINGKPVTTVLRHESEDSSVYISWRLFSKEELPTDTKMTDLRFENVWMLTASYNEHNVEYVMDNDYFVVNGIRTSLIKPVKWVGSEPFISINDLAQMFEVSVKLDESGMGLYIESA
ncbi:MULTISPECIES: hypothetical protein [unclassified Paenibacillus]|uniref:hypothetical protein n=1 Tax=unclassified Paenibacillus TaxID=185978 RepID=UPI0036405A52